MYMVVLFQLHVPRICYLTKFKLKLNCNGNRYINHFYSLAVEAGIYGWLFHEVKQCRSRLVPGWVTGCSTLWTTWQTLQLMASGGMEDDITIIFLVALHRLCPRICYVSSWWFRDEVKRWGRNVTEIGILTMLWKPAFMATQVEWMALSQS